MRHENQPTTSQIYAAFSADSHVAFQAAMTASCGGVVRVQDLIRALIACEPEIAQKILADGWWRTSVQHRREGIQLVPMANEPSLREVLRTAYQIALSQEDQRAKRITPATLWAAIVTRRHLRCLLTQEELFRQLNLNCPTPPVPSADAGSRPLKQELTPSVADLEGAFDSRDLADVVLERWVAAQSLPPGTDRDREMAKIAELTKHLVSQM